jgi:hypothetical protein
MVTRSLVLLAAALGLSLVPARADSPVAKVLQLLSSLEAKVIKEGEDSKATFAKFAEWCEDRSKNLAYEIKTGEGESKELAADIQKAQANIEALTADIETASSTIATAEADLKAASTIRATERKDFTAAEAELVDVIGAMERAIGILEREMRKGSASMLQLRQATNVVQALKAMVAASMLNSQDATKLTALVQSSQQGEDQGEDQDGLADAQALSAPEAAAYEGHSGDIIETLEGLLDKAKDQLDDARKKETNSKHNFEMLEQSLKDEIKFGNQDLQKAKKDRASESEAKASAEGDLKVTAEALKEDKITKSTLKEDCTTRAQDFEAETKSRAEELKALAEAKRAVKESTGVADSLAYGLVQTSFLQLVRSDLKTGVDLANFEAVRYVRTLAEKTRDPALAQLAMRMASAMHYGSVASEDPFTKVRQLIMNMITKLEKDAGADASHKAYCDKELGETLSKKDQKEQEIDKLTTQIDSDTARSQQLKEQVATLQEELAELATAQAEATKIRQEEHAQYEANKPEMEQGLEGVKTALKILREYYAKDAAHDAAEGASSGVISLLEVVESDFSKLLAEMTATETTSQADYDRETRENEILKTTKEQDVVYKTKEHKQLDNNLAEDTAERSSVQTELSAIMDYKAKIQEMCVAKAEPYAEAKRRREEEISGLKEALQILEGESVLIQRRLRGFKRRQGFVTGELAPTL